MFALTPIESHQDRDFLRDAEQIKHKQGELRSAIEQAKKTLEELRRLCLAIEKFREWQPKSLDFSPRSQSYVNGRMFAPHALRLMMFLAPPLC